MSIFIGKVTRLASDGLLYVKIDSVSGDEEIGPFPAVGSEYTTDDGADHGGAAHHHDIVSYKVGDFVAIGQIESIKEQFVILGRLMA